MAVNRMPEDDSTPLSWLKFSMRFAVMQNPLTGKFKGAIHVYPNDTGEGKPSNVILTEQDFDTVEEAEQYTDEHGDEVLQSIQDTLTSHLPPGSRVFRRDVELREQDGHPGDD